MGAKGKVSKPPGSKRKGESSGISLKAIGGAILFLGIAYFAYDVSMGAPPAPAGSKSGSMTAGDSVASPGVKAASSSIPHTVAGPPKERRRGQDGALPFEFSNK